MPSDYPQVHLKNVEADIAWLFERQAIMERRVRREKRRAQRQAMWQDVKGYFTWLRNLTREIR